MVALTNSGGQHSRTILEKRVDQSPQNSQDDNKQSKQWQRKIKERRWAAAAAAARILFGVCVDRGAELVVKYNQWLRWGRVGMDGCDQPSGWDDDDGVVDNADGAALRTPCSCDDHLFDWGETDQYGEEIMRWLILEAIARMRML
eukprot:scaffold4733_cov170-Alexandrium_tamarense.AAC.69